jgi:hypothetical protein
MHIAPGQCRRYCIPTLIVFYLPHYYGITSMNLELIGQLVSIALVLGAGPIIIASVFVRGGNL